MENELKISKPEPPKLDEVDHAMDSMALKICHDLTVREQGTLLFELQKYIHDFYWFICRQATVLAECNGSTAATESAFDVCTRSESASATGDIYGKTASDVIGLVHSKLLTYMYTC